MRWDLFCRVVDNFGDVGVCWRLACNLARRGDAVRLWIDDPSALSWLAPGGQAGVSLGAFDAAQTPGDVVIEAFGCDPPTPFVSAMVERRPVWINLEYLSAEAFVERSHGLPSPQPGGLTKWFFFPGFSAATGGLLREQALGAAQHRFDRLAWLRSMGLAPRADERVVSLFCYDNPALPAMLKALGDRPTLLLLTPGPAQQQVTMAGPGLRTHALPFLSQAEFDHLLWSCDLNFVRGEDSLVRALWAGVPFVWQLYPQHDGAQARKLQAFVERMPGVPGLPALFAAWNGIESDWPPWPEAKAWRAACRAWREELASRPDLATALRRFAQEKSVASC